MTPRCALAILFSLLLPAARADDALLVGRDSPLPLLDASSHGVLVEGSPHRVPWSQVLAVTTEDPEPTAPWLRDGARLRRAAHRLAVADPIGAETLLDQLETSAQTRGPTASTALALRAACRLRRLDRPGALAAWLRAEAADDAPPAELALVLDADARLIPDLSPVWTPAEAADFLLASDQLLAELPPSSRPWQLASLYAIAAALRATPERRDALADRYASIRAGLSAAASADRGVHLVLDAVGCQISDDRMREACRRRLRDAAASRPDPWVSAWSALAGAASMLDAPDDAQRSLAVVRLIDAYLQHADAHPMLAADALLLAAVGSAQTADLDAARALRRELAARFPHHPGATDPTPPTTDGEPDA